MFSHRITLFKLFGFPVRLDASWLIIAVLVTWSLAVGLFPAQYPGFTGAEYWWMAIASALGLFGSIIVHEFAHSLVARQYGLPMNGITLFIFGGVAEMGDEPSDSKTEFLMAVAGPVTSVILGFAFYLAYRTEGHAWPIMAGVTGYLCGINWLLAAFNLIPAFPLDGGRILRAALWRWHGSFTRATRTASAAGSWFAMALTVLAVWQLVIGNFMQAIWWFLIGLFLHGAAQSSYQR